MREITVPLIFARSLIVEIHGKCSMGCYCVRLKTRASWLNWPAIYTLATGVVNVGLQLSIRNSSFRYTPSSSVWCWSYRSCWSLSYVTKNIIIKSHEPLKTDDINTFLTCWLDLVNPTSYNTVRSVLNIPNARSDPGPGFRSSS